MRDYYLYLLDRRGRIERRVDLIGYRDDDHALEIAATYPHYAAMELWEAGRFVEVFAKTTID